MMRMRTTTVSYTHLDVYKRQELISIYYGSDVSEEQAEALCQQLEESYPDFDVEMNNGGQPIYYYVISVE